MEGAPAEENLEILSIDDRLSHKSWKARLSGYNELIKSFKQTVSESDPVFRNYVNNPTGTLKEWVRDSNAVSQEKGVEVVSIFIEFGGKQCSKARPDVMPSIVEKCLGSARSQTKTKAIEVCLLFVEVEEDQGEGVISDLTPGLDVKQPKVVAGVVTALREIVRQFGAKAISIKSILRLLPKIFSHADKTVRSEGTLLALALHSYLGPALTPHLSELKPVQVKELTEAFDEADKKGEGVGNVKPTRFTRTQQRERQIKEAEGALEGKNADVGTEAEVEDSISDPFEFVEPAEVLASLPEDFYTNLSAANWKARKELALEPLLTLVKVPRIKSGNYAELVSALAARMADANVACVSLAANCLEALALGLREEFGKYREAAVAPVLARTKEKKASVLDALGAALDAFYLSVSIGDITSEIVTYSKDKNPSVKAETIKWYIRCLKLTTSPPPKSDLQPLTEVLMKALEDSGEPVRLAAAEGLGTLMKVFGGERAFGGQLDSLDTLRKAKVMEAFESAVVKCKGGIAPSRAAAPEPTPAPLKPKPKPPPAAVKARPPMVFDDEDSIPPPAKLAPKTAPLSRPPIKRPPVASTSSAPPPKKIAPPPTSTSKAAPLKPSEPLKYKFNQEDAEAQAETIFPSEIFAGLSDGNWKIRLGAIESLHSWLSNGEMENVESELVVRYLSKKPGWKESNFQVSGKMFSIFQLLAEESPSFSKASIALATPGLSDKLGDIKLKKPAGDALIAFTEKSSLQFVLSQAYEPMTKQKAPKAQADSMVWVDQAIRDFGIGGLSVREMIDFLKVGLKSTNAAVRTSATKTLVTVKLFVGADISTFLQDLNPALLTTIESEFAKISGDTAPEPTRIAADSVVVATGNGKSGAGKSSGEDALDDLYPRVDLDKLVSSATITSINDANWKTRKESLETIQSILEANKRLKPSNLPDLTTALKLRLADSNKIVQVLALDVVARIATGMEKAFDKHGRIFATPVAGVLADQKANIRAAGITTLSAIADASGLDSLIVAFEKPLDTQNPLLRKELLNWLETRFEDEDVLATLDLTHIAAAILSCLEDRNADVRKSATALLPSVVSRAGFAFVMDQTSKLKPASRSTVVPLIESARGSSSSSASSAPVKAVLPSKASAATKSLRTNTSSAPSTADVGTLSRAPSIRPVSSIIRRAPIASTSRASPVVTPQPASREPPFKTSDLQPKSIRSSKETGSLRWVVENLPRPDQIESLFQQMTPVTSSDLLVQLFSTDHNSERDFAAGLSTLIECAKDPNSASNYDITSDEMRARLLANLDVIFKYITLRIGLPSTTITVKCLDLIEALLTVSDADGYKLSDYETTPLLISLIGKVGDGKETIRQRIRAIFRSLCDVYPSSRIFSTILDHGLTSKNARTRTESAEELGSLFKRHGVGSFSLPKALPALAKLISDRDASVRTAALTAIGSAYTIIGAELIYKHIGSIPDKEKTMLEERLKRTAGGGPISPARSASTSRSATPSRQDSNINAASSPAGTPRPTSMIGNKVGIKSGITRVGLVKPSAPISNSDENESRKSPPSKLPGPPRSIPRPSSTYGAPPRAIPNSNRESSTPAQASTSTTGLIQSIVVEDTAKSTDSLKQVQHLIATRPDALLRNADELIEALVRKMSVAFSGLDSNTSLPLLRLCKHIMQTLSHFFDNKTLGQSVTSEALSILLAELAGRLLDTAQSQASEAIASLSKVLNMVLIRIFHHANQTACFTALFTVLQDATIDLRELKGEELAERAKYAELVMKCLWKVSKTVKDSLVSDSLSASRLLRDINAFLVAIPPAEWRRRVSDSVPLADMPLRTVKTILQQIVSVYADNVYDELDEVDKATTSFVYQYLLRLVANNAAIRPNGTESPARLAAGRSTSSSAMDQNEATSTTSPPRRVLSNGSSNGTSSHGGASPENTGGDIEMNQQLKVIFDTIGDPGRSREGIAALYQFQKQHPEASARISTWMSKTGNYFQTYLKRALDNLATADKEKNDFESPQVSPNPSRSSSSKRISTIATTSVKAEAPAITPRSISRPSTSSSLTLNGPTSPGQQSAKLAELQSMFGFSSTENGRM